MPRKRHRIAFSRPTGYVILYVMDCLLSLFVIPVCAVFAWSSMTYIIVKTSDCFQASLIIVCWVLHSVSHLCCKFIYRSIREHIISPTAFYVVSKLYLYVFGFASVVIYGVVPDRHFQRLPNSDNPYQNIALSMCSFSVLMAMKCRPMLADAFGEQIGQETTPEEVFLFPFRFFNFSVIFSESVDNRLLYFFISRLYTEIFGIASVSSWYGIWAVFDSFAGANVKITVSIVILSYVGLISTKTVRNITASPFAIITDKKQGYFDVPTLFRWSFHWKKNKLLYALDSIFSVLIVGTLVILVWRGAWCLLDQIIYSGEDEYALSGWTSLVIGYIIVFVTFSLQSLVKVLTRKYSGWKRLVILDIYVFFSFCGTINVWRGIWALVEIYTDLENSLRNCVLLHFSSFIILVIFNSSNTLLVRGVYLDAEESDQNLVEFPCYYFRLRFQEKQKKKTWHDRHCPNIDEKNVISQGVENHCRDGSLSHSEVVEFIDQYPDAIDAVRSLSIKVQATDSQKHGTELTNGEFEINAEKIT